MKKIIVSLLILSLALSFISCEKEPVYEPIPSTEAEERVVMTLSLDGESYEVKYELYRALFLTYADEISGEDKSVWEGDKRDEYMDRINEVILERVCDIYSVFAVCKKIGYDLYSKKVNSKINEFIKESVEGGTDAIGYGSYEAYLEALYKMNLNYSVQNLLFRYAIGLEAIDDHYIGTFDASDITDEIKFGELTYTKDDVKAYYNSDECVRVLRAYIQASSYYDPMEYAERVRNNMLEAATKSEDAVATVVINTGLTAATEVQRGYVMGRYNLDALYYSKLTEAAMSLSYGEVSDVVEVHNGEESVLYILYSAGKSDEHFNEAYSEIAYVYLTNAVGEIVHTAKSALKESVEYAPLFSTLSYQEVTKKG